MKFSFYLLVLLLLSKVAFAQNPATLMRAMHCIKSGDRDWLSSPLSEQNTLRVGFIRDTTSYPGERHLVVAVYQSISDGQVFDLREESNGKKHLLTIENNGKFSITGKGKIKFVDPPLGGVWTQQFLEASIIKIQRSPKSSLGVSRLKEEFPDVACRSYAQH